MDSNMLSKDLVRVSVGVALVLALMSSLAGAADNIRKISPPAQDFFSKATDYQGIEIKASSVVDDRALLVAKQKLSTMLANAPEVVRNLRESGCELHIIGARQSTSDLPENRHWKGKLYEGSLTVDQRTRGVGGRLASCAEENLLELEGDRYFDRDICIHEFAHTIMQYGLDNDLRARINSQYERSKSAGLWRGCYAMQNSNEFWAELSMWYFGSRGDYGKISPPPVVGRQWFVNYDSAAFDLLDSIYSGRLRPQLSTLEILTASPPGMEGQIRSENSSQPTTIFFVNLTGEQRRLFWLDFEGKRKFYSNIPPFGEVEQSTFRTHPWLVTDDGGTGLAIFLGASRNGRALVTYGNPCKAAKRL